MSINTDETKGGIGIFKNVVSSCIPPESVTTSKAFFIKLIKSRYPNGGRVLDLGAGTGSSKQLFDSNWEWIGVDIYPESDLVLKADAHNLSFSDNYFDLVISIAVFEISKAFTCAPFLAKITELCPLPHPKSRTLVPIIPVEPYIFIDNIF